MIADELGIEVKTADMEAMKRAVDKWNAVAKPIGSLGLLEDVIVRIAGMKGSEDFEIGKRAGLPMCADNGVVEEGVTQSDQDITALVCGNMGKAISSVCRMGAVAGVKVFPVNIGVADPIDCPENVIQRSLGKGTANMTKGPAMSREQALEAIRTGIELVGMLKDEGYGIIATGEMGIGNTTTSSAVGAVLLNLPVEDLTGRGAGLSSEGLQRKINAIKKAIEVNQPDASDPIDVLAKVGGFDIAGMVGTYIGGAVHGVPILIDGFISSIAALIAVRVCPESRDFMIPSHVSAEPAGQMIMEELGLPAIIHAQMRLGEGTGAVTMIPLLDMAMNVYNGRSFSDIGMDAYEVDLK